MDIRNMPAEASNYEFVVIIPNADHYTFLGKYTDGHKAEKAALEYGGIVIHNVRIHGYHPPEKKHYIFSGLWSWDCWAINEEEARKQFDHDWMYVEVDTDYDHIEIEVDE